ncbi:MAG TPA: transposase [Trebonia sp.]|nr:transposase [Trebonia sp.]
MIEAMIAGERDPHVLAEMAMTRMRPKIPDLVKAFTGMRFWDQHAFAAASLLREIDFVSAEITALEEQAAAHLATIPAAWGVDADGTTGPDAGLGPHAAVLPAAARLDEITGIGFLSAAGIIAEIGLDMSRFPTPDALVSWAACPGRRILRQAPSVQSASWASSSAAERADLCLPALGLTG